MFAVNNGVVTYNGTPTTNLSPEQIRRMYGSAGNILGANERDSPDMFEDVYVGDGDAGGHTERRVRQDLQNRLYRDGQWWRQVGNVRSVGGEGEVSNLDGIQWDDELGYITPMSNVREYSGSVFTPAMLALAGGMLGAVGAAGGFSGLLGGAGASGFPAGAGIAGPSLETAGVATGALDGAVGVGAGAGAGGTNLGAYGGMTTGLDGAASSVAREGLISSATQSPSFMQQLMTAAQNNPMSAARALLGGANVIDSLRNRGGGGSSSNPFGDMTPANVTPFNPSGLLANYRQREIPRVPFMSLLGGKNGF